MVLSLTRCPRSVPDSGQDPTFRGAAVSPWAFRAWDSLSDLPCFDGSFEEDRQVLDRRSLSWDLSDVSLRIEGFGDFGKKTPEPFYHISDRHHLQD